MSRFAKATKKKSKARVALVGPSGSGKTYTALVMARGLAGPDGRIAVIDTERGSASKYAGDVENFDALDLDHHAPAEYVEAIKDAAREGYDVLVIDSLSHAWNGRGGALEMVDNAAKRTQGNSFAGWRDVTPQHNALVDAILAFPGHVIVTMRAKTEYVMEADKRGKMTPRKVGMAPIQRDGVEYEFDVVGDMDFDHNLVISKSRCSALADAVIAKPTMEVAETLRAWLSDGVEAPTRSNARPADRPAPAPQSSPDDAKWVHDQVAALTNDADSARLDMREADDVDKVRTSYLVGLHRWVDREGPTWLTLRQRDRAASAEVWGAIKAVCDAVGSDTDGIVERLKRAGKSAEEAAQ